MANLGLKKAILFITLGMFWSLSTLGVAEDSGVLVSPPASDNTSRSNTEETLVDIKAVDAPAVHMHDGKLGVGSEVRYGQGIIIDSAGIIATNRHIIRHAQHIFVVLSGGNAFEARVLRNSQADLCLIKIDAPYPLRAISLADSSEIQAGLNVIAIANAGLNPQRIRGGQIIKLYTGVASNKIEILEMNIPLKPGDSGGPVLNEDGSLLGLIMAVQISDPTKSYAIASNRIQQEYFNYRNSILN